LDLYLSFGLGMSRAIDRSIFERPHRVISLQLSFRTGYQATIFFMIVVSAQSRNEDQGNLSRLFKAEQERTRNDNALFCTQLSLSISRCNGLHHTMRNVPFWWVMMRFLFRGHQSVKKLRRPKSMSTCADISSVNVGTFSDSLALLTVPASFSKGDLAGRSIRSECESNRDGTAVS